MLGEQNELAMVENAGNPVIADVRKEWAWVKKGIEEILASQPQLSFRPEDVYAECLSGAAHLWVAPEGFVVSTGLQDQYTDKPTFFIWLAWAKKRGQSCVLQYYDFFAETAKRAGYADIEVRTPIPAMEGYLLAEGWQKDTVIYTREL